MDLSMRAIQAVVHPTAIFVQSEDVISPSEASIEHTLWAESQLNPKNRIDSLSRPEDALWRVDGCTGLGTQYYAVPHFLHHLPPMRIDVFIPHDLQSHLMCEQLDLNVAFHTKDATRLSGLAVTNFIIRTLDLWVRTRFECPAHVRKWYQSMPFGSRLIFRKISPNIQNVEIEHFPNHNLEHQLKSIKRLQSFWGEDFDFPPQVSLTDLHIVSVLHDSVCLVRIKGELYIFKGLTSGPKFLYHELKTLCKLKPHPNIIGRPCHIVMKTVNWGSKLAVAGFTTFFHANGSLRDLLPQLRIHSRLDLPRQLKWCLQLARALNHLRETSGTYYPDLRLDNIVLSRDDDLVMVDFEQRGVWCEFAAPEVNYVEYIRLIATDEDLPDENRERYQELLRSMVADYEELEGQEYTNPDQGHNVAWNALDVPLEHESAEVYMLGRVLWCIFEGVSGPQKAAVWQSYPREPHLEFPAYDRTPLPMRDLIDRCTGGRRKTMGGSLIERRAGKLALKDRPIGEQTAEGVLEAAKQFWTAELRVAEEYLAMRVAAKADGTWTGNFFKRPSLKEVLQELEESCQKQRGKGIGL